MLVMHAPSNCILNDNFKNFEKQKNTMKNGKDKDHLVLTLEDDISDQVLKCKNDEDSASGSSSVAQWIKSLKENNVGFDDSNQDAYSYPQSGSSSDQDDLQLGAEATDLRKKQKTCKSSPSLSRDSDSDSSYQKWCSWTGRRSFLTNRLSYDRSLDSDTSGLSSVTSVSSLLTARESDPEDVLKGLGFRGPSVLDKIPDRFIAAGTVCDGVDSEQFLCSVQDECDNDMYMNSEVPPWVMARYDEIPRKFWKDDIPQSSGTGEGVPIINEPLSDEAKEEATSRPPKTFPSRFGTYLEPVTEEAELSSQGSVSGLSPSKKWSFESNRSTLKGNSQDGPENMAKIPSLCDLWQTTEEPEQITSQIIRSEDHGIVSDDIGNNVPSSNVPGEVYRGGNGDWIDQSRDDLSTETTTAKNNPVSPWSSTSAIVQNIPAITCDQWCPPITNAVPTLSSYLDESYTPVSEDRCNMSNDENVPADNEGPDVVINNDHLENSSAENSISDAQTKKPRLLSIPTVTISEPDEKSRKISTVDAPDFDKLLPLIWPDNSEENKSQTNIKCSDSKGKVLSNAKQEKAMQFTLYGSQNWAKLGNKKQSQIQFSSKGNTKSPRRLSTRSRKTIDTKVTLTVSHCKKTQQVTVSGENYFTNIPCFSHLAVDCPNKTGKSCLESSQTRSIRPSGCFEESRTNSIQLRTSFEVSNKQKRSEEWGFKQSENSNTAHWNTKTGRQSERENDMRDLIKRESLDEEMYDSKTKCDAPGVNVEVELDELQNSLKGVKMYKAGIHLMQLASSIETVMCSEKRPKKLQKCSGENLLDSIQKELKHLEEYILKLQNQLRKMKKRKDEKEKRDEEVPRRGSDFSDITRQLLQEQLKMFSSISSTAVTPTSTPSVSPEPSLCSETPDVLRHTDVMKLRKEMQQIRQDSVEQNASMKEEILSEVRAEIRKCFQEFVHTKSP